MTAVSTWHHHPDPNRGKRRPRVYEVRVTHTREQADLENEARRLGYGDDMSRFFIRAAYIWRWLMTEAAFREESGEAHKAEERRDREELRIEERRQRQRWDRESKRAMERELALDRREAELARREQELQAREGAT